MKNLAIAIAMLVSTNAVAAENLYCFFTEPFISVELNGVTKEITKTGPEDYNPETDMIEPKSLGQGKLVKLNDDYLNSAYELRDANGSVIVSMVLNMKGSDGMSDSTYPFTAYWGDALIGGCYTDSAKPWNPYEIDEALGTASN